MKMQKLIHLVALTVALFLAAGCHKGLQKTTPLPGWAQKPPGNDDGLKPIDSGIKTTDTTAIGKDGLVPMGPTDFTKWKVSADQPFTRDTVYFDFDKSTIK